MTGRSPTLTESNHANMDAFFGYVLDCYKTGSMDKTEAVGYLTHVVAAVDIGNYGEAINWFEQGRKLAKRANS